MSSRLNVAAASEALALWVHGQIQDLPGSHSGSQGRPDSLSDSGSVVNVFLFEVTKSAAYSNLDLPTRDNNGKMIVGPVAACDCHFMLTFLASSEPNAQILLGTIVRAINASPGFKRSDLSAACKNEWADATLPTQHEVPRLTLRHISYDEMAKIWGMFPNKPYRLSIGVTMAPILMEADAQPESALPVQTFTVGATTLPGPTITSIFGRGKVKGVIHAGDELVVMGQNVNGKEITLVTDDKTDLVQQKSADSPTGVVWVIPTSIKAGVRALVAIKTDAVTKRPMSSNAFPLLIQPQIVTNIVDNVKNTITLTVTPPPQKNQIFEVGLTDLVDNSNSHRLKGSFDTGKIVASLPDKPKLSKGAYVLRVRVDGAESFVTVDNNLPHKVAPVLEVP